MCYSTHSYSLHVHELPMFSFVFCFHFCHTLAIIALTISKLKIVWRSTKAFIKLFKRLKIQSYTEATHCIINISRLLQYKYHHYYTLNSYYSEYSYPQDNNMCKQNKSLLICCRNHHKSLLTDNFISMAGGTLIMRWLLYRINGRSLQYREVKVRTYLVMHWLL